VSIWPVVGSNVTSLPATSPAVPLAGRGARHGLQGFGAVDRRGLDDVVVGLARVVGDLLAGEVDRGALSGIRARNADHRAAIAIDASGARPREAGERGGGKGEQDDRRGERRQNPPICGVPHGPRVAPQTLGLTVFILVSSRFFSPARTCT